MLVYLLIPVALAIVFFTMSFLQRDTTVQTVTNVVKEKTKKAAKKASSHLPKKLTTKDDEDKPVQSNFVEEMDIKDYATIQGRVAPKAAPKKSEKEEKKEEKKQEKKDEKQENVSPASPEDQKKKKKKQTDWIVREQKPQRKVSEKKEEETTEGATEEGKKDAKKKDGKKEDRKKGEKHGDKKKKKGEEGAEEKKSIYKAFKPHGADADKAEADKKDEPKEEGKAKTETHKEGEEKSEKKDKKEKKEKTERPKKKGVAMISAEKAYANPDDFWTVDHKGSYVEPPTVTTTTTVLPTTSETTEKKKEKAPRKDKQQQQVQQAEVPTGKRSKDDTKGEPATIKVNTSASLARTDPWKGSSSPAENSATEDASTFPALGEKTSKIKKLNKKKGKQGEPAPQEETQEKKNDHKREADTLFEYEVEAPSDKKIKLGAEAQQQPEHQDEKFVLPASTNAL